MIHIDVKFVGFLSARLDKFSRKKDYLFAFRCPYCGDSKKNPNKVRGFIYRKKESLFFKCHNCGVGTNLSNFIKYLDPVLHKQYVLEKFSTGSSRPKTQNPAKFNFEAPTFRKSLNSLSDHVCSIDKLDNDHPAKKYLIDRKIPNLGELFYTDDFKSFVDDLVDGYDLISQDKRIIIPFYNDKKELIAIQGRSLGKSNLRYITVKIHEKYPKIFGMDKIDKTKTVYVLEGPFDSLFLVNSVAMAGSDLIDIVSILGVDSLNFVFDNEPRNKVIVNKMDEIINKGYRLCIWPDNIREKDINDMILGGVNPKEIKQIVDNNSFEGLKAKVKLTEWRKC